MHQHAELIEDFYSAFAQRDHATMARCYHPEATFRDQAFDLRGREIGAMWHMLCSRGKDMQIEYANISADASAGQADWTARYTFSTTGRYVVNVIHASFRFQDGAIIRHDDHFSFWRWSRQALGPAGLLLGWMPLLRKKVRSTARQSLDAFIAKHPEYHA